VRTAAAASAAAAAVAVGLKQCVAVKADTFKVVVAVAAAAAAVVVVFRLPAAPAHAAQHNTPSLDCKMSALVKQTMPIYILLSTERASSGCLLSCTT
jgi:hypothetical protein